MARFRCSRGRVAFFFLKAYPETTMEHVFTDQNFESEVLKSSVPVLVDFWAPWCGPCRAMGPIVEQLAAELDPQKIKIGKYNVDENGSFAQTYGIQSIPTFLIFKNGKVSHHMVGGQDKESFQAEVLKHVV